MHKVDVITMGCSKNLVDSERFMYQLQQNGYCVFHNPKCCHRDIAVVNTCGFIGDAKQESIEMILSLCEAKQKGKLNKLYVTGCLSEQFYKELKVEIPMVDGYYGKFNYDALVRDMGLSFQPSQSRILTTPKHYAYLKISEGCDRKCAYCAIPIITGRHKSRPIEEILNEVKELVAQGVKEFQVIAQELTFYGIDLYGERKLAELVERISDIKGVEWIRLHYAYPNAFPEELLRVMRERDNVCKYLDIAFQHINDGILEKMHRHTTKAYQMELIQHIREEVPGINLRTTLMVGFPGEGNKEFEELLDFTRWARFERMAAFAYSQEEGTWAAKHLKDCVSEEVKEQRLSDLMELQQNISEEICETRIGKTLKVIIDGKEGNSFIGRTEFDSPEVDGIVYVTSPAKRLVKGRFYDVKIEDSDEFDLYGTVVQEK